jgi:hypothetical protein
MKLEPAGLGASTLKPLVVVSGPTDRYRAATSLHMLSKI